MLCTKCGRPVKPVVSIDIDGTLGDYHGHFVRFAEAWIGRHLPRSYDGSEEFSDFLRIDKRTYRDIKLAYRQGGLKRSMPMFHGVQWFMTRLAGLPVEVWLNTTRPWLRLDNIDPDTRAWLDRNAIPYDSLIYGEDKYANLASLVEPERILIVAEDILEECRRAEAVGLEVIQPEREHNRGSRYEYTFGSFERLLEVVKKDLSIWEEKNV